MSRPLRVSLVVGIATALVALPSIHACASPLRVDPLHRYEVPPVTDGHLELARKYAPWIFHAVHAERGRQDVPAPVDFDGDLVGTNNWRNLAHYELLPTVYYACLESETHWFVTYHLFHPRDWATLDLGLHLTHEGDGENLQVVVEKSSGEVVLLFTQAHYRGGAYASHARVVTSGARELRDAPLLLVDDDGRPAADGTHAAVYVQSGGHGIYAALDGCSDVALESGELVFEGSGIVLRAARAGERVDEPDLSDREALRAWRTAFPYRLESTTARLWPLLARGELTGEGRLLDGPVPYRDARIDTDVPRYYEADRFSGPFGPDRGISPFAVDVDFEAGTLGSLFFDPARRYAELYTVPDDWSLEWVDYPFTRPPLASSR